MLRFLGSSGIGVVWGDLGSQGASAQIATCFIQFPKRTSCRQTALWCIGKPDWKAMPLGAVRWRPSQHLQGCPIGLQSGRPATGGLNGNSLEVLWKVLPRVPWEIGVLGKVLLRVLREIGVLQKVLPRVLFLIALHRKSTLGSTFWSTPISRSTLRSTFPSTPISHGTLGSTFQSTSRQFLFSPPVAGRPDCKPMGHSGGLLDPLHVWFASRHSIPYRSTGNYYILYSENNF